MESRKKDRKSQILGHTGKEQMAEFAFSVAKNRDEKYPRKNWPKVVTGMLVEGIRFCVTETNTGCCLGTR